MAFLLSKGINKLREGATSSFQQIAKNIMIYENNDDDEDVENLDQDQAISENNIAANQLQKDEDDFFSQSNSQKSSNDLLNDMNNNSNNQTSKRKQAYIQNYEAEEFEQRIKGFQNILRENELTIDKFKRRVVELEQQMIEMEVSNGKNPVDKTLEGQVEILLNALNQERSNNSEKDKAIDALEKEYNDVVVANHRLRIEYSSKVKEIESTLSSLVVSTSDQELKQMFAAIKQLLIPTKQHDNQKWHETISNLERSNQQLKEINATFDRKLESLDAHYKNKMKNFQKQVTKDNEKVLHELQLKFEISAKQTKGEQANLDELVKILERNLVEKFKIENVQIKRDEILTRTIEQFSNAILSKTNNKITIELENIMNIREIWEQFDNKLKGLNLNKFKIQAQKESQQTGQKLQSEFKETDLYKLFDHQLQTFITLHSLVQEQNQQIQDLSNKRETLNQQFTKLQKECREMSMKEKESSKLRDQLDTQSNEHKSLKQQLQDIVQDKISFKVKLEEQRDKLEMLIVENGTLKEKIGSQDDEHKNLKKQLKYYQSQQEEQENFKEQLDKSLEEQKFIEACLRSKEGELAELKRTINKLQRAVEQQQEEYEQMLRMKEREQTEDKMFIQQLQMQVDLMKDKIREHAGLEDKLQTYENEILNAKDQLEKSDIERKEVKKYAQDLLDKVQKDKEQQEFMVDRRLINKFLINYANIQSTPEVKMQMLDTMSKILGFTMEEKFQLGLVKKQSLLGETVANSDNGQGKSKGIGESLINFFLEDDDDE